MSRFLLTCILSVVTLTLVVSLSSSQRTPNPALEIEKSVFFVNDRLRPWERGATPRRAMYSRASAPDGPFS